MALPKVVIVGRPNVGKSSLFNWLAQRRIAIVDDMSGVTRDRVSTLAQAGDEDDPRFFDLIDTGGVGMVDRDDLSDGCRPPDRDRDQRGRRHPLRGRRPRRRHAARRGSRPTVFAISRRPPCCS